MTAPVRIAEFQADENVRAQIAVALPPAAAFEKFRHDIFQWWPHDFTWSGEVVEDIFFEGRKNGMIWERGPEGIRFDMARVLRWVPPEKMVLRWHVGPGHVPEPDPAKASEVEIQFLPAGGGTRVTLEHRGFARHGKGAVQLRNLMAAQWPLILKRFAAQCGRAETGADPALAGAQAALHQAAALV